MGLLLDIVPNHMAASPDNPWWMDVLAKKQDSPFASFFDTDWLNFRGAEGKSTGHRRFFAIDDLIGIRVEDPRVFAATHSLVFQLIAHRQVTGLRIDHIDGLYDPLEYLLRLQQHIAPHSREEGESPAFYIVVEKILSGDETIPEEWPAHGTTGYDFAVMVNALLVDGRGVPALDRIYSRFTGSQVAFADVVYEKKRQVIRELFPGEINALGQHLAYLAQENGRAADLSREELTRAIAEITACLPVYRTYIRTSGVSPRDRRYLELAVEAARRRNPDMNNAALDFVKRVLDLDWSNRLTSEQKEARLQFVLRWQQLTGATMAKGFEDTALYCYNRLVSLNEVGGDPASSGLSIGDFHNRNLARLECCPHTLNTTSTHDTKRSEDVRARINVLSEIPEEWEGHLIRWQEWNQPKKTEVNGMLVPEPNTEMLLYQTLLGAWPLSADEVSDFKERLKSYMVKAVREAKVYTDWSSPNSEYEGALTAFVESILENSGQNEFLADFLRFQKQIAFYGALNSVAQVLLKVTSPGVPDFYQGTEVWDFSLVDPDNRRPVDFRKRMELLAGLIRQEAGGQQSLFPEMLNSWADGRLKLYVTCKALNARSSCRQVFLEGQYIPLQADGPRQENVAAFMRYSGGTWVLVVVPRLLTRLVGVGTMPVGREVWGDDRLLLPGSVPERWLNVFTGETLKISGAGGRLPLSSVLSICPVALLTAGGRKIT
jgi:(1->4)-alpha-D-glucan 1-alpha-D-glucosylmutase